MTLQKKAALNLPEDEQSCISMKDYYKYLLMHNERTNFPIIEEVTLKKLGKKNIGNKNQLLSTPTKSDNTEEIIESKGKPKNGKKSLNQATKQNGAIIPRATYNWVVEWMKGLQQLNIHKVLPVLKAVNSLKLHNFRDLCLTYIYENISSFPLDFNWSSLDDETIQDLAVKFKNIEIEDVYGKIGKELTNRLYTVFIKFLINSKQNATTRNGHYETLDKLFRCKFCERLVNERVSKQVPCLPYQTSLTTMGTIEAYHSKMTEWSPKMLVNVVQQQLKDPRSVYWQLWGQCHFIFCATCQCYFPASEMNRCKSYSEVHEKSINKYDRRYYNFEPIPGYIGMGYLPHTVDSKDNYNAALFSIYQKCEDLIKDTNCVTTHAPASKTISFQQKERASDIGWINSQIILMGHSQKNNKKWKTSRGKVKLNKNWSQNDTIRDNQDRQRDYEERLTSQLAQLLQQRAPSSRSHSQMKTNTDYKGGIYIKLESQWSKERKVTPVTPEGSSASAGRSNAVVFRGRNNKGTVEN